MRSTLASWIAIITLIGHEADATARSIPTCFAAGGFGASKSKTKPKKTKNKKGGLLEFTESSPLPQTSGPKLDRFGLPIATEDDVFPPLSDDDFVRIPAKDAKYDRSQVAKSIENHLGVNLSLFDEHGHSLHSEKNCQCETKWQLHLLHADPPVFQIDNFFTPTECSDYMNMVDPNSPMYDESNVVQITSPTFANSVSRRTSTTWFCRYSAVSTLLAKAAHLLHVELSQFEEPQIVRYRTGEEFSWHYDEIPKNQLANGGQRLATLLVYLNDLRDGRGGGTVFRDLMPPTYDEKSASKQLTVQPSAGKALLFFPSFKDGKPDERTLHKGEVALDKKMIAQLWVHEREYRASVPVGNRQSDADVRVEEERERLGFS